MSKITLNAHPGEISKGIEFIREVLTEKKVSKKRDRRYAFDGGRGFGKADCQFSK